MFSFIRVHPCVPWAAFFWVFVNVDVVDLVDGVDTVPSPALLNP